MVVFQHPVPLSNRIPVEILKSQYSHLSFDFEGRLLMDWDENEARLALDMLEPVIAGRDQQVVDARHMFARKHTPGSICGNRLLKSRRLSRRRFSAGQRGRSRFDV
jgi:hypothetical protein